MRAKLVYLMQTSFKKESHNASRCTKCGKCEPLCPQGIKIIDELSNVSKKLEGFTYKPITYVAKKFMKL